MKKTLVGLFALVALAIGIQVTQAACPCQNPCPAPCTQSEATCPAPCETACPAAPCNCNPCDTGCRKKCTWWKIFEDKTCCDKCNNQCPGGCTAKRAHWYAFWTDRCVVSTPKCEKCKCDPCN